MAGSYPRCCGVKGGDVECPRARKAGGTSCMIGAGLVTWGSLPVTGEDVACSNMALGPGAISDLSNWRKKKERAGSLTC